MWTLKAIFPTAEDVLAAPTRRLAGYILLTLFDSNNKRTHPKNIRNYLDAEYPGPLCEKVAKHVLDAFDLLKREEYIYQDYRDAISSEWVTRTDKGLAITDPDQLDASEAILSSNEPLVFISCGQFADNEKAVGHRLAELVNERTDCVGYFAERVQSLSALSHDILGALNRAAGMIVVMHNRGTVETPNERFSRGSVWVEQEIAIAAFIQSTGRNIPVAAYIQDGIKREGLRDLLHLNPLVFHSDDEITDDFEKKLRTREFVPNVSGSANAAAGPRPRLGVEASIVSPDESRARGIYPVSNAYRVLVQINNAGGLAKNIRLHLKGYQDAAIFDLEPMAPGASVQKAYNIPHYQLGQPGDGTTPSFIEVTYDGEASVGGSTLLARVEGSHPPRWQTQERRDPR